MTEERGRLVISIAAAVLIHLAVLLLSGMYSFDYETSSEYGPITVEIDLSNMTETPAAVEEAPEPETGNNPAPEPEPLPEAAPEVQPAPAQTEQLREENSPAKAQNSAPPKQIDYSSTVDAETLKSIRSSRSSAGSSNTGYYWGDDVAAPRTDDAASPEASGSSGSEVVWSENPAEPEPQADNSNASAEPADDDLIPEDVFSNLEKKLASGGNSGAVSTGQERGYDSFGTDVEITFQNSSVSLVFDVGSETREPIRNPEVDPEDLKELQRSSVPEYRTVVEFDIDADGFLSNVIIAEKSGESLIDAAVQKALRKWQFEPGKKVHARLTYIFKKK